MMKEQFRLRKINKFHFILVSFFTVFYLIPIPSYSNPDTLKIPKPKYEHKFPIDQTYHDSLNLIYGKNKTIPASIAPQALIALSYYPELINTKIIFKIGKFGVAHMSRPKISSMISPFKKRHYVIYISNEVKESLKPTLHRNLSFNAKIGVLGHELGHTAYYINKSFWDIIGDGIKYSSEEFKVQFEQETDIRTINHNLGYQLYHWSNSVNEALKLNGRDQHYLSPQEILIILRDNPIYKDVSHFIKR